MTIVKTENTPPVDLMTFWPNNVCSDWDPTPFLQEQGYDSSLPPPSRLQAHKCW